MTAARLPDEEVTALVRRVTEAAEALIRGDIRGYVALIKHADDYTLMSPYGGETVRGFDESDEALDGLARFFRGGEATVEVVETYASGGLRCACGHRTTAGRRWRSSRAGLVAPRYMGISTGPLARTGNSCIAMQMRSCMPSTTRNSERWLAENLKLGQLTKQFLR
jgi:hypothetical protein